MGCGSRTSRLAKESPLSRNAATSKLKTACSKANILSGMCMDSASTTAISRLARVPPYGIPTT